MSAGTLFLALAVFLAYALAVAIAAAYMGRSWLLHLVASILLAPLAIAMLSRGARVSDGAALAVAFAVPTVQFLAVFLQRRAAVAEACSPASE